MKLLLCTLEYPPQIGGVANYYANLLKNWPQEDSWVLLNNNHGDLVGSKGPWCWRKAIFSLWRVLRREKPDFVFLGQILPLGTVALLLNFIFPFKFGIFLHGMDLSFALKISRKRWLTRLILKKAQLIVCANSRVREILLSFLPDSQDKIFLLHPGASVGQSDAKIQADYRERYDLSGKKIIFSIGRLVKRKGFDQVIKALELVKYSNWLYLLAGNGPEMIALKEQAAQSPLANKIIFAGLLNEKEKWSCLNLCDIFISSSRDLDGDFEGFGIVYLEANLMSKAVIAGRSGGVGDAVIDGLNGLLVDPEDPQDIAKALDRLMSNPEEATALGVRGRERAEKNFSWPGQAKKLKERLNNL
jgi:phosphatidylinositol alpha-1,6-mannosyltransferase